MILKFKTSFFSLLRMKDLRIYYERSDDIFFEALTLQNLEKKIVLFKNSAILY